MEEQVEKEGQPAKPAAADHSPEAEVFEGEFDLDAGLREPHRLSTTGLAVWVADVVDHELEKCPQNLRTLVDELEAFQEASEVSGKCLINFQAERGLELEEEEVSGNVLCCKEDRHEKVRWEAKRSGGLTKWVFTRRAAWVA